MGKCSTRTLHSLVSLCNAGGSAKPAGKYNTGAALILGSTTLWQSVVERVRVSHAEEMYSRIGFSPFPRSGVSLSDEFWEKIAGGERIQTTLRASVIPRRIILEECNFIGMEELAHHDNPWH